MDDHVVATAQPIIGRQAQQNPAAGLQHAVKFAQGMTVITDGAMIKDVEGRHQIERGRRERQGGDGGLAEAADRLEGHGSVKSSGMGIEWRSTPAG